MAEEGAVMFRHTIPLCGLTGATVEQLEDLVEAALMDCDRIYPALLMVVWGGTPVREALDAAMLVTVGEACSDAADDAPRRHHETTGMMKPVGRLRRVGWGKRGPEE